MISNLAKLRRRMLLRNSCYMQYEAPWGSPGGPHDETAPYINGNPAVGVQGSIPPAAAIEYPQREIVSLIKAGGFTTSDNDLQQLRRTVREQVPSKVLDTSTLINQVVCSWTPALDTYRDGTFIRVRVKNTNTGPMTINVNSIGNAQIVRGDGSMMGPGECPAGCTLEVAYDSAITFTPPGGVVQQGAFVAVSVTQGLGYLGIIDQPITVGVFGSGAGSSGTPNVSFPSHVIGGLDYAMNDALYWVSRYIITQKGFVTFICNRGQYVVGIPIYLNHPNADRIKITSAGVPTPPQYSSMIVTGSGGSALAADQANVLAYLRGCYPTELRMVNSSYVAYPKGGELNNLLISADGSQNVPNGPSHLVNVSTNVVLSGCVSIHGSGVHGLVTMGLIYQPTGSTLTVHASAGNGFNNSGWFGQNGAVYCTSNNLVGGQNGAGYWQAGATARQLGCKGNGGYGFANFSGAMSCSLATAYAPDFSSNGGGGVWAGGGIMTIDNANVSYNYNVGVNVGENASVSLQNGTVLNNAGPGFSMQMANVTINGTKIQNNSLGGIQSYAGLITANNANISNNASTGGGVTMEGGTAALTGSTITNNGGPGISANTNAGVIMTSGTVSGNTGGLNVAAAYGANIVTVGATIPAGTVSPALNTVGNGNALVSG